MKKYLSLLKILLVGLVLSIGFQYVLASRPGVAPTSTNDITVIDTANNNDTIKGRLKIGEDWSTDPNISSFEQDFSLAVIQVVSPTEILGNISSTGLRLSKSGTTGTGGDLWIGGTITSNLKDPNRTTNTNVCADLNGTLIICPN